MSIVIEEVVYVLFILLQLLLFFFLDDLWLRVQVLVHAALLLAHKRARCTLFLLLLFLIRRGREKGV